MKNEKIKNYFAYFILFLGIIYALKTAPLALHKFLGYLNIKNYIGMDLTNYQTFALSAFATDFYYALFLFSCLSIILGLLILFRQQQFIIEYNYTNLFFLIMGLIIIFLNLGFLLHIYLLMIEDDLFSSHIIFPISFLIAALTYILVITIYILIWFDQTLSFNLKIFYLILLFCFADNICFSMLFFINIHGIIGQNPDIFIGGYNYILSDLGLGSLCMDSGPCDGILRVMQDECNLANDIKNIPRIPNGSGSKSFIWIARITNLVTGFTKYKTQKDCDKARSTYNDCIQIFKSMK